MFQARLCQFKVTSTDWTRYRIMTMGEMPEIKYLSVPREDGGLYGFGVHGSIPRGAHL